MRRRARRAVVALALAALAALAATLCACTTVREPRPSTEPAPAHGTRIQRQPPAAPAPTQAPKPAPPRRDTGWAWPVEGVVSSLFGSPRSSHQHAGIDILAAAGTPVKAARGGKVVRAGRAAGYGLLVVIDHGEQYTTWYAHNRVLKVEKGDKVAAGATIAEVGTTGNTTAPHLHFELRRVDVPLDPLVFLPVR